MNFWTFLDRNGNGIGFLIVVGICLALGIGGPQHEGCRVRCGTNEAILNAIDGGAP